MEHISFFIILSSVITILVVSLNRIKSLSPYTYKIKRLDGIDRREIVIAYNKKGWNIVSIAFVLFILSIFGSNYFLSALVFLIYFVSLSGEYSKRVCIIKNILDNSLIICEQAILKEETSTFLGEEKTFLETLGISYGKAYFKSEKRFALALASNNKTALLRFVSPPYLVVGTRVPLSQYRDVIMLGDKEIQDIATFLNLPISSKSGDLVTLLKEKGLW